MLQWITDTMNSMGYFGIVLMMFLENVFPPIPSELIMPLAGFTATQGKLSFAGVVIAGMTGSVLGALPLYYLGKTVGEARLKSWADKYGQWLTISSEDIEKSRQWFERHGIKAVFLCHMVPGVRSLISIPAGMSGMSLPVFVLYSALGTGLWAAVLAYVGHLLGENFTKVDEYLGPIGYGVLGAIVLVFIVRGVKQKKRVSEAG